MLSAGNLTSQRFTQSNRIISMTAAQVYFYRSDLLIFNVHLPCCKGQSPVERQQAATLALKFSQHNNFRSCVHPPRLKHEDRFGLASLDGNQPQPLITWKLRGSKVTERMACLDGPHLYVFRMLIEWTKWRNAQAGTHYQVRSRCRSILTSPS
jgi:hypothetical protein